MLRNSGCRVGDRAQAEDARPALRRTLRGHVLEDARRGADAAGVGGEKRDDAGPQRQAARAQGLRIEGQAKRLGGRDERTEVAADQDGRHRRLIDAGYVASSRSVVPYSISLTPARAVP